jgi:hypothetical protein
LSLKGTQNTFKSHYKFNENSLNFRPFFYFLRDATVGGNYKVLHDLEARGKDAYNKKHLRIEQRCTNIILQEATLGNNLEHRYLTC